jgi:hypothetical protein
MPEVREIKGKGKAKAFVELRNGIGVDLLVVPEESFEIRFTIFYWKQGSQTFRYATWLFQLDFILTNGVYLQKKKQLPETTNKKFMKNSTLNISHLN